MLYLGRLYYACEGHRMCVFDYGGDIWGDTTPIERHLAGLFNLHERYADIERGLVPGEQTLDDWRIHAFVLMERITGIRLSFESLRENALYRFWVWGDPPLGADDGPQSSAGGTAR